MQKNRLESLSSCRQWVQMSLFERQCAREHCPTGHYQEQPRSIEPSDASNSCTRSISARRPTLSQRLSAGFSLVGETVAVNDGGRAIGQDHVNARYLDSDVERVIGLRAEGYTLRQISEMMEMPIRTLRGYLDGSRRCQSVAGFKVVKRWKKS